MSYYTLLQLYTRPCADGNGSKPDLPLRLKVEIDDTINNSLALKTVVKEYVQIMKDLDFAE